MPVQELKKQPVWLTVLYSILSLGIYINVWFYRQRNALNALVSKGSVKLSSTTIIIGIAASVASAILTFTYDESILDKSQYSPEFWFYIADRVTGLMALVATLFLAFRTRDILQPHVQKKMSGVLVFFLSIFFLQYHINRLAGGSRRVGPKKAGKRKKS